VDEYAEWQVPMMHPQPQSARRSQTYGENRVDKKAPVIQEARARCDSGNLFVEGLLTNAVELQPDCRKGLAHIEQVLMDEVAKILAAESLADLRRYDHETTCMLREGDTLPQISGIGLRATKQLLEFQLYK